MSIIPILPVILQDGTVADANQVMANFNQIQADVNANCAHSGVNSDITSLIGLTTPLPISEGGTGAATAAQALINLGVTAALAAIVAVPIGGMLDWGAATAPTNFLECNGQAISRNTYSVLFAVIGTTFGVGDGATTFNIPDLRGYFVRGWSDGSSIDSGRSLGSIQAEDLMPHTHAITDPGHTHVEQYSVGDYLGGPNATFTMNNATPVNPSGISTVSNTTGITVQDTGTTETRPINIALMKIIRVL